MTFFYFLPMLIAIAFLLARASRGEAPAAAKRTHLLIGLLAVVALGIVGAIAAAMLRP